MKKLKSFFKSKAKDQSGQGMAEYVLLIVVVVGVAFMFKDKIKGMVETKLNDVGSQFQSFDGRN